MPVFFPAVGPDGDLIQVKYWNVTDAAPLLHVTRATLREKCRREEWPHLTIGNRFYFCAADLARIVELMRTDVDDIDSTPVQLGTVAEPRDEGGVR